LPRASRLSRAAAGLSLVVAIASCAPRARVLLPEGVDLVFPQTPPGALSSAESRRLQNAWGQVMAGDPKAVAAIDRLRRERPGVVAFEAALGFARLRSGDWAGAAQAFDAALARDPQYLPGLLGAGAVARRRADPDRALAFYRRALEASPQDPVARRRLGEVKLQVTERHVGAAQAARQQGDLTKAAAELRAALDAAPELADVRIDLAQLLLGQGDAAAAVAVLEADPAQDRHVLLALAELLTGQKDYPRALESYRKILQANPRDAEAQQRAAEVRRAVELLQMPEEYRRIAGSPRVTRADLAALIAVKVTALQRLPVAEGRVATDVSGSWARAHILRVLSLDVMEVYPNHTFQPGAVVRRGDVAAALGKVLDLLGWPTRPAPVLKDVSPTNLLYPGVTRVVSAGIMDVTPDGAFEAWRQVSGKDAMALVEALARVVGP